MALDENPSGSESVESAILNVVKGRRRFLGLSTTWWLALVAIVAAATPFAISAIQHEGKISDVKQYLMVHGYYAMDEQELREIVKMYKLNVYWTGPAPSITYSLDASNPDHISVRYLRFGRGLEGTDDFYRAVVTYQLPNAYSLVLNAGKREGGYSFKNVEGNSVYFNRDATKNVYVGIKGKDTEIEIFDDRVDQALAVAMSRQGITRITQIK